MVESMNMECSNNTNNGGFQNSGIIVNGDNVILALTQTIQRQAGLIEMLTNRVIELENRMLTSRVTELDNKLLQYDDKRVYRKSGRR